MGRPHVRVAPPSSDLGCRSPLRRLDAGIESKEVGLSGNINYSIQNLTYFSRVDVERAYAGDSPFSPVLDSVRAFQHCVHGPNARL